MFPRNSYVLSRLLSSSKQVLTHRVRYRWFRGFSSRNRLRNRRSILRASVRDVFVESCGVGAADWNSRKIEHSSKLCVLCDAEIAGHLLQPCNCLLFFWRSVEYQAVKRPLEWDTSWSVESATNRPILQTEESIHGIRTGKIGRGNGWVIF